MSPPAQVVALRSSGSEAADADHGAAPMAANRTNSAQRRALCLLTLVPQFDVDLSTFRHLAVYFDGPIIGLSGFHGTRRCLFLRISCDVNTIATATVNGITK